MNSPTHHKVTATHLQREAYLYVRQSPLRQVIENTESTKRQYARRDRAVALGWPFDHVVIIDSDLGRNQTKDVQSDTGGYATWAVNHGWGCSPVTTIPLSAWRYASTKVLAGTISTR